MEKPKIKFITLLLTIVTSASVILCFVNYSRGYIRFGFSVLGAIGFIVLFILFLKYNFQKIF
jgi:hypothetical protein